MASLPKKTVKHFTHPAHPLKEFSSDSEYLCNGCKTTGAGERYRCHGCNFDLHEYCSTCPEKLRIFVHQHELSLVMRKAASSCQVDRTCDVCRESVKGLFYRCKDCDFDVHPLCTQLPQSLRHGLHRDHPLMLKSSPTQGSCAVCKGMCTSWRYRCSPCGFDLHFDCVLVDIRPEACEGRDRGIKNNFVPPQAGHHHQPPPPHFGTGFPPPPYSYYPYGGFYPYGFPPQGPCPPGPFHNPNWVAPQPHNDQVVSGSVGPGRKMFALVGKLGMGVVSNAIFGIDITAFF